MTRARFWFAVCLLLLLAPVVLNVAFGLAALSASSTPAKHGGRP